MCRRVDKKRLHFFAAFTCLCLQNNASLAFFNENLFCTSSNLVSRFSPKLCTRKLRYYCACQKCQKSLLMSLSVNPIKIWRKKFHFFSSPWFGNLGLVFLDAHKNRSSHCVLPHSWVRAEGAEFNNIPGKSRAKTLLANIRSPVFSVGGFFGLRRLKPLSDNQASKRSPLLLSKKEEEGGDRKRTLPLPPTKQAFSRPSNPRIRRRRRRRSSKKLLSIFIESAFLSSPSRHFFFAAIRSYFW